MLDFPAKNLDVEFEKINEDGGIRIHIFTKREGYEVGHLTLHVINDGFGYETHSGLYHDTDRGRGYGFCLYYLACQYAEHKKMSLESSSCPSEYAQRAWRSRRLNEIFEIEEEDEVFKVIGRR